MSVLSLEDNTNAFCCYHLPGTSSINLAILGDKQNAMPLQAYFTAQEFDFYKKNDFQYFPLLNVQSIPLEKAELVLPHLKLGDFNGNEVTKQDFINFVNLAKEEIKKGSYRKVVASRTHFVPYTQLPNFSTAFLKLCKAYPNSFVCFYAHPELGMWITASPELFLKIQGNSIETVSLAGTRSGVAADEPWGYKELDEQEIVSIYQEELWKRVGVKNVEIDGPAVLDLRSIQHLKTSYKGEISDVGIFEKLAFEMHPTPAVGGFPKADSLPFIENNEKYNREMYAGFFGISEGPNQIETYVQLRTARVFDNGILFFAGAGITEGSDAEAEWIETENKCKILSNFL